MLSLTGSLIAPPSRFEWVGLIVSIAALLFATRQYRDAGAHSKRMSEILDRFDPISKSLTTQFVGLFPKNLEEILSVVSKVDNELLIMTDFVGYGHYSRPDTYDMILGGITKVARDKNAKVHILVYADDKQMGHLRSQFKEAEFETKTLESTTYKNYFQKQWKGIDEPKEYQPFLDTLLAKNREFTKSLLDQGVQVLPVKEKLLFLLWLEDDQDAVIAFQNSGADEKGFSFRTRDAHFISTFREIFVKEWNKSVSENPETAKRQSCLSMEA